MITSDQRKRRKCFGGFSYIELMVVIAVLAVLASAVIPVYRWHHVRRKEVRMRAHLHNMRTALDLYHEYATQGKILMEDVEQEYWPLTLEELAEGVVVGDPATPDSQTIKFILEIPVDPFTGEAKWGLRSYQDDFDSRNWGGENVYDVYSLATQQALDDSYYSEW